MKTVMVTGASGFLGKAVIRQVLQNSDYELVAVTSGRREVSFPDGVRTERADLLEESARAALIDRVRPEILVNLAWVQDMADYKDSAVNMQWLEASTSLLRHFAAQGGKCVFFAGTSAEYGSGNGKAQEKPHDDLRSVYGECKKAFSEILANYCEKKQIRYIDARLFTVFGEGDPHYFGAIPQAVSSFLKNRPFVCKAPNEIRDYIYVEDAARAAARLIESDFCGSVNIASGQPRSMREVFCLIADTLGKRELLSFENENNCAPILVADVRVLQENLGVFPEGSFEEKLKRTVRWWSEQTAPEREEREKKERRKREEREKKERRKRDGDGNPAKAIVTGASGLLGGEVVRALSESEELTAVAVSSGRRKMDWPSKVEHLICDLLEPAEVEKMMQNVRPGRILHLAWGLADGAFLQDEGNLSWLIASIKLLAAFCRVGGKRFIFAGSSSEYGQYQPLCAEIDKKTDYSLYGISKLAFERIALTYCKEQGISFCSARFFSIYGPGDIRKGRALPTAIKAMLAGERFVCRSPNNIWDYIYVADAAAAAVSLLKSEWIGVINIGSGNPISMREVFEILAREMNCDALLDLEPDPAPGKCLCADVTLMRAVLGNVCKTAFADGIRKTVRWWKETERD